FFSSRRRHTSFSRDWSSDVCSSDLWLSEVIDHIPNEEIDGFAIHAYGWNVDDFRNGYRPQLALIDSKGLQNRPVYLTEWNRRTRSEERRVGDEGSARGLR